MSIAKELKTIKTKVSNILETKPKTRDSDLELWLVYLEKHSDLKKKIGAGAFKILKATLKDSPQYESISRQRRKLQEVGLFIGQKRINRLNEAKKVKSWAIK